jgi:hypothetical protein
MLEDRILFFYQAHFFADPRWSPLPDHCPWPVTGDKRDLPRVRCVVFHLPSLRPDEWPKLRDLHKMRPRGQVWVAFTLECVERYPLFADPTFMALFDYEMSYRQDADFWSPYMWPELPSALAATKVRRKKRLCCAFISSGLDLSGRQRLLRDLMDHLPVDSYGRFLRNRRLFRDKGTVTKLNVISRYRFTLAFENTIGSDYVTEKFFQPLRVGSIPVYLGAPNIDEFSPGDDAFINAADFGSAKELADYLMSADDDRHHTWRQSPLRPAFLEKTQRTQRRPFDELCARLEANRVLSD